MRLRLVRGASDRWLDHVQGRLPLFTSRHVRTQPTIAATARFEGTSGPAFGGPLADPNASAWRTRLEVEMVGNTVEMLDERD